MPRVQRSGSVKVQLNDAALKNRVNELAADAMEKLAVAIIKDAVRNVHVDTGYLQSTAYVERRGNYVEFGFHAWYAEIEEYRDDHNGKHAYLRPAMYRHRASW